MSVWSRHSLRRLPMNLSHNPLARGARYGVLSSLILEPAATAEKYEPYLLSRSWRRYFGPSPQGVASRSCWAVHSSVGEVVTATWTIRRVLSTIKTKIYHVRNNQSLTTVKLQAYISLAWFLTKVAHVWLDDGDFFAFGMYFWMVLLHALIPSFRSSPRIRSAPHKGFSLAILWMIWIVSSETFCLLFDFCRQ